MLNKELFEEYINLYKTFDNGIERISEAIVGPRHYSPLFECDWVEAVGNMLDLFLESHFTEEGVDIINWWLFEDVDHKIWQKVDPELFDNRNEIEYDVNDINDLWNYLVKYKEDYFLNE